MEAQDNSSVKVNVDDGDVDTECSSSTKRKTTTAMTTAHPALTKTAKKQPAARLTGNLSKLLVKKGYWVNERQSKPKTQQHHHGAKKIPGRDQPSTSQASTSRSLTDEPMMEDESRSIVDDISLLVDSQSSDLLSLQSVEKLIREAIGKDHVMEFDQSAPSQFSSEAHPMTWQERGASIHLNSKAYRPDFLRERIRSQPLRKRACDNCRTTILMDKAVRCMSFDCKTHLCSACDTEIHLKQVFHSRELVTPQSSIALLPTEFFNLYWEKTYRDVAVPLFTPPACPSCDELGTLKVVPQTDPSAAVAVIIMTGRFDLKWSSFSCSMCSYYEPASVFDYANSGFRPPQPTLGSYLFATDAFVYWHHYQHRNPGASLKKFIQILEEISKEYGRTGIINPALFSHASKEWELQNHEIQVEILSQKKMECYACGPQPLTGSADGNVKLRRFESAGKVRKEKNQLDSEISTESNFGNQAITSDHEIQQLEKKIDEKVKRSTKKEMCGGAVFKAARSDSSKFHKSDETGVIMTPCRHGVVLAAMNMFRGETFVHTLFMHILCYSLGCKFFCNDVICRYWKFAKRVAESFPEYAGLTEMGKFLPRMHAKAHKWACQVLYNPHWQKGVAATIGEEHEQVFSHFSLYGNTTKRMTAANRNDHLTAAIFYWNRRKFEGMIRTLDYRLTRARKRVRSYRNEVKLLLAFHTLRIDDLPRLWQELVTAATNCSSIVKRSSSTELGKLRKDLEGMSTHLNVLKIKTSTEAEHCKARTKLQAVKTKLMEKVRATLKLVNEKSPKGLTMTEEDFYKGRFPWLLQFAQSDSDFPDLSFDEKFKIVDTWMLWCRYKEEIVQTKTEMLQFIKSLKSTLADLDGKITCWRTEADQLASSVASQDDLLPLGKAILAGTERDRIFSLLRNACAEFRVGSTHSDASVFSLEFNENDKLETFEEDDDSDEEEAASTDMYVYNDAESASSSSDNDLEDFELMYYIEEED